MSIHTDIREIIKALARAAVVREVRKGEPQSHGADRRDKGVR